MISDNHDPLAAALAGLAVDPPAGLIDRVIARWVRVPGPIGPLYVAFTKAGIAYVRTGDAVSDSDAEFAAGFRARFARPTQPGARPPAGLLPALRTGRVSALRFDLRGLGSFDQAVLAAAATIPRGQVRPYRWIAEQVGRPGAVRAVGSALGRNPVPVLIGCHRVIRSDGAVGDYVFGAETKSRLLAVEGANLGEVRELARRGVRYLASDTTGVVCFPSCAHARRITAAHRQGFASVTAAQLAGYRPCRHCQPIAALATRETSS
ncbi:MAG TPA: methylated-DNA--[protein]-cysteine S-methyltransferase [Pseudonocardiaceae bacterium]|nr:methylated-DNA--[protein]-cysteine S-methyltransferase [Pseudonocardiaceae bacterium]